MTQGETQHSQDAFIQTINTHTGTFSLTQQLDVTK